MNLNRRLLNFLGAACCAGLMGFALFAQYVLELEPCNLCVLQRVAMIALGIVALAAALHHPGRIGARVYGFLTLVTAGAGVAVAGRHVWLQNLPPDQVPECGPGIGYLMDTLPFWEMLSKVFAGSGDCATVVWNFLGLSMPAWVLVWFVGLGVVGVWNNVARP